MDYEKFWWISWVGDKNKPNEFSCVTRTYDPDADLAYRCDPKRKLFSLAEVCALPSVVLVYLVI